MCTPLALREDVLIFASVVVSTCNHVICWFGFAVLKIAAGENRLTLRLLPQWDW